MWSLTGSHLHSFLPTDPQVTPGQETGNGMAGQRVDPTFESQLCHYGIDPRKSSFSLLNINCKI